jgi:hypothetical protein
MGKRSGFENKIMMTAEVRITEGSDIERIRKSTRGIRELVEQFPLLFFSFFLPARNAKLGSSSKQVEATLQNASRRS